MASNVFRLGNRLLSAGIVSLCITAGVTLQTKADVQMLDSDADGIGDACETVWCVRVGAAGTGDGSSWADAFPELRDALTAPTVGTNDDLWVAAGTYKSAGVGGSRTATFRLRGRLSVYGGFPVSGGTWADRDPRNNETVLSGDLNGDDNPSFANRTDNSYHVVTAGNGCDRTARLDGLTIRGGYANGSRDSDKVGAGVYNVAGSPTIRSCVLTDNWTEWSGAGVWNETGNPMFVGCVFLENFAANSGAGVYNRNGQPKFLSCSFYGNVSRSTGGALANYRSVGTCAATLINCALVGNVATNGNGGAVCCTGPSYATLVNCTVGSNVASRHGGGVYCANDTSLVAIRNSILWGNESSFTGGAHLEQIWSWDNDNYHYTCIEGYPGGLGWGEEIIADDPLFAVAASDAGDGWGNGNDDYGDLRLGYGSPCIDHADNAEVTQDVADLDRDGDTEEKTPFDIGGSTRFVDDLAIDPDPGNGTAPIADMGAYEYAAPLRPPRTTAWRSVRTHGLLGELAIELDASALGGSATVETRRKGVQKVEANFDAPVQLVAGEAIEAVDAYSRTPCPATNAEMTPDGLMLTIEFEPPEELISGQCFVIDLAGKVESKSGQPIAGDTDCMIRVLTCDLNGDGAQNNSDRAFIASKNGHPVVPDNIRFDVNLDGAINTTDRAMVSSLNGTSVSCPAMWD